MVRSSRAITRHRVDGFNVCLNQSRLIELTSGTCIHYRPLNTIGLPYYDALLLSSWHPDFVSNSLQLPPPPKIPPQVLSTMKIKDNVAYATLPKELKGRRNVVATEPRKSESRFRSEKMRQTVKSCELHVIKLIMANSCH